MVYTLLEEIRMLSKFLFNSLLIMGGFTGLAFLTLILIFISSLSSTEKNISLTNEFINTVKSDFSNQEQISSEKLIKIIKEIKIDKSPFLDPFGIVGFFKNIEQRFTVKNNESINRVVPYKYDQTNSLLKNSPLNILSENQFLGAMIEISDKANDHEKLKQWESKGKEYKMKTFEQKIDHTN